MNQNQLIRGKAESVDRRERYLSALVDIQNVLISAIEIDNLVYNSVLKSLGTVAEASRVYVFTNTIKVDGRITASLEAEWCASGIKPQKSNPELQNIDYEDVLPGWYKQLANNNSIEIVVSELAEKTRHHFEQQDIQSLLILPYFVNGDYSGFIGFDNCTSPDRWSQAEVSLLRIASTAFSQTLERIQTQLTLKKNEIRYRGLIESQTDLVVRVDSEGRFTFINDAYCKMFGKTREELIGRSFTPLVHEDDLPQTLEKMKELDHPPYRTLVEQRAMTANGWRWLAWEDYAIKDDAGRTIEIQAIGRDIHDQRLIELEFQREHEFVMQVIDNMGQGLVVLNKDGTIRFTNLAFSRMVNYSQKDLTKFSFRDFVTQEDWEKIEILDQEIEQKSNVVKEIKILRSTGEHVFVMLTAVPIQFREAPDSIVIVITDLTDRNQVEIERRKNDVFLRGVYNITSSQEFPSNEKIQLLLQLGCQEFEMQTGFFVRVEGISGIIIDYYSITEVYEIGQMFNLLETYSYQAIQEGGPIAIENAGQSGWAEHACYKKFRLESYIGVPVVVSGQLYGYLSFSSKYPRVRKFRSVEKEILRLIGQWVGNEIAQQQYLLKLKESAEEIKKTNLDLEVVRDQALEASRLKSEFLATMSHEIRTPLNAVIGMTELLSDTALNQEQVEYTEIVRSSAKLLLKLINDILDFSKIEAGRLHLENEEFDLIKTMEEAVDLVVSQSKEKGIGLLAFISPEISRKIIGDPYRLRQVLVNLIGNAIKFTDQGEVLVQAILDYQDEKFISVRFEISDTGIGLSAQARKRLFQPFTQADGSTTRKYGGTGLGLAISKRIVEEMDGEIGVESEEGKGSTFWFTARFLRSSQPTQIVPNLAALTDRTLRVLLFGSNAKYCEFLSQYLISWGMEVLIAWSAGEVLPILKSAVHKHQPFDLLMIDQSLDDANGIPIINLVLKEMSTHKPLMILLTTHEPHQEKLKLLNYTDAAVLTKPIKQSTLFDTITNLVSGQPLRTVERGLDYKQVGRNVESAVNGKRETPKKPARILIVEDNEANQRLAQIQLMKLGYEADKVSNGAQAVRLVREDPLRYQIVLMDCHMPVMDGFEATRSIREMETSISSHVIIIAMTANALAGDRETCIQAGMDDYISKPISLDRLATVLSNWGFGAGDDKHLVSRVDFQGLMITSVVDPRTISGIRKLQIPGEADFLTELIDMYLDDSWNFIKKIEEGITQNDKPMIKSALHSLHGISVNMGAVQFAKKIDDFENYSDNFSHFEMQEMLIELKSDNGIVCETLQKERKI